MSIPTKLFHYSHKEISSLKEGFYEELKKCWPEESAMKPCGFWVSVEDNVDDISWFEWCQKEEFNLECLKYKYSVSLSKDCKILHLKTKEQVLQLSTLYQGEDLQYPTINWTKVKDEYDGIIISPYQWYCRLKVDWYYSWDCSSGCIWNLKKIKLKLVDIIYIEALKAKAYQQEEMTTDSLLASLVLSA